MSHPNKKKATANWYLRERGKVVGTFSDEALQQLHTEGRISRFHTISRDQRHWESALSHFEFGASSNWTPSVPDAPSNGNSNVVAVTYRPFPIAALIALHYATFGIFTFFWITSLHGRLPALRPNHPSGGRAVLLAMLPFVNLYWAYLCYPLLAERLNELMPRHNLKGAIPMSLVLATVSMIVIPMVIWIVGFIVITFMLYYNETVNLEPPKIFFFWIPGVFAAVDLVILIPALSSMIQTCFNDIAESQQSRLLSQSRLQ